MVDRNLIARNFVACSLFQDLKPDDLQAVYRNGHIMTYKPNFLLLDEGQDNANLYVLLHGEVEVFLPAGALRFDQVQLVILHPGSCIGEYSFLDDQPTSASVRTTDESLLFQIDKRKFQALLEERKGLGMIIYRNLLTLLVRRLRDNNEDLNIFL